MKWMLEFSVPQLKKKINYSKPILLSGSCFAEQMGNKLRQHRFRISANAHGILYNPLSMALGMADLLQERIYSIADLTKGNGLWFSWQHHGKFSANTPDAALAMINNEISAAQPTLKSASHIVITLGSAWVYQLKSSDMVVANCHKMPAELFTKRLLTVDEIVGAYLEMLHHPLLKEKQIILSVSPVRYVRDGLVENNLSKSILLQAVHTICRQHENAFYFPAFEIIIDQLRDYRFFERDLVHPNQLAIDEVWQHFVGACMDKPTDEFVKEMGELNKLLSHKVIHADTTQHQSFQKKRLAKMEELKSRYPEIDWRDLG
ncbi:MAG: GSCFA domain-containing protein [Bacteroidota bacterium]